MHEFDHPFLGMAFGVYQLWQERQLIDRIGDAAPYIATVQLSDWKPPRHDTDRLLPGDGEIPMQEIVDALSAAGYRGDFEIDVWSSDLWKTDYDSLLSRASAQCRTLIGAAAAAST